MGGNICIKCCHAVFIDTTKEICYKTGGLFCKKLKTIVGKYDECKLRPAPPKPSKRK